MVYHNFIFDETLDHGVAMRKASFVAQSIYIPALLVGPGCEHKGLFSLVVTPMMKYHKSIKRSQYYHKRKQKMIIILY